MAKVWTTADIPSLAGKIALVTGATGGLGYETALALAQAGAAVIVAGRNEEKGETALKRIRATVPEAKVVFLKVDLTSLASVREFAANLTEKYQSLDILVNNAGVMYPPKRKTTQDGFEIQFGTNHLSHFVLTAHLLILLRKSSSPRIVNVSSSAHRQGKINFEDLQYEKGRYNWSVYAQSKLANLLFTFELQRRSDAGDWGITSIAAHPGLSRTELVSNGPGNAVIIGWILKNIMMPILSQSAADGSLPILFAATSPDARSGGYYGPNGFYEMSGAVSPSYIAPNARDAVVAAKLWDISVRLTGARWPPKSEAEVADGSDSKAWKSKL